MEQAAVFWVLEGNMANKYNMATRPLRSGVINMTTDGIRSASKILNNLRLRQQIIADGVPATHVVATRKGICESD